MSSSAIFPRRSQPLWPVLKPLGPASQSRAIRVNRSSCLIGDRSRCHLLLRSPLVSRSHALVIVDAHEVYIRDLASRNRLFVNGWVVREAALRTADVLQIGPFRFRCHAGFAPAPEHRYSSARRAVLTVSGSKRGYALDGRTFLIGSREECDLKLTFPAVSEVHSVIFRRAGHYFIRDLNSRTGTFVNGRRVREAQLADGDQVRCAVTMLNCELFSPQPQAAGDQAGDSGGDASWSESGAWQSASAILSASSSAGAQTMTSVGQDLALATVTELFPPEINLPDAKECMP